MSDQVDLLIDLVARYRQLSDLIQTDEKLHTRYLEIQHFSQDNEVDFLIEELPNAVNESMHGVDAISAIVRSMKSLVHPGSQELVDTDVNEAIDNAVTLSQGSWKHCLDLATVLQADLPLVSCYDGELGQVIINLIVNAAHAIEETGRRGQK